MYVHCKDGLVMELKQYRTGFYYFDVAEHMKKSNLSKVASYDYSESFSLVQTVKDNMENYTKR